MPLLYHNRGHPASPIFPFCVFDAGEAADGPEQRKTFSASKEAGKGAVMGSKQKYYAVRRGRTTGVYATWEECRKATQGFSGAVYKSFPSRKEAESFVSGAAAAASGKYYAVRRGEKPGIYRSWEECQQAVGKGKGAVFKSFATRREAEGFCRGIDIAAIDALTDLTPGCPVAFTDGSFSPGLPVYGYGAVIIFLDENGMQEEELSGCGTEKAYLESRNIAGETLAVLKALEWALDHGYSEISIHYDYAGLEKCITGAWSPKKPVLVEYVREFRERYENRIRVRFHKVKGHSNNTYNDRADLLAKAALTGGKAAGQRASR